MDDMWESVDLASVMVTDRYYDEALHIDVKNMLLLDPDRLLAGFRETAGRVAGMNSDDINIFMKHKERYGGGWENGLIGGHTLGHYITALAQAEINPGLNADEKKNIKERLDYMLDTLKQCQDYTIGTRYDGYIFGATLPTKEYTDNPALEFDLVEEGKQNPFTEAWVPWYTMHKILSGLNAAFKYTGSSKAIETANRLGLWIARRCESWSEEINRTVLSIEYGGMNDCLYELYQINRTLKEKNSKIYCTEFDRFKKAAHCFDETDLFEKVLTGDDDIFNNVHANTTIPKFIGALARFEVNPTERIYLDYAEKFWDIVVKKHTYVTGGNSEDEHFGRDNILDAERTNVNNETCNTYNMIKLSRRLFAVTGKKKYLDYCERTLINAIMASQDHESGFTTYFQPMGTGYHKVFNTLDGNFWCCTGTGYENFTKLQKGIYYKGDGKLVVSMYLSSVYIDDEYTLEQKCDFTTSDIVKISIDTGKRTLIDDLYLRIPVWLRGKGEVRIGNIVIEPEEDNGFYVIHKEEIINGGAITIRWPMGITCHNLPDGKDTYAFCYGPYVLSARLGTAKIRTKAHGIDVVAAAGKSVDSDKLVITVEKSVDDYIGNIDKYLVKRENEMEFDLVGTDRALVFTTHYNQYKESYGIYWKYSV